MLNEELNIRKNTSYSPKLGDKHPLDSPAQCHLGAKWWANHIWQNFSYNYNEDGFRQSGPYPDADIIATGDSFTEHHGGPEDEAWPKHVGKPVINLGVDGAGNDTIADIVEWGVSKFNPKTVLVMFSYLHRWNDNGKFRADDVDHKRGQERMLHSFNRILECTKGLNFHYCFVPDKLLKNKWAGDDIQWLNDNFPNRLQLFPVNNNDGSAFEWDYGRDAHHFGPDTVRRIGYEFSQLI
tara:strand:+ start:446 stop:1159 length:714 start_codon:yes stop_codon:yes gene_type:complete